MSSYDRDKYRQDVVDVRDDTIWTARKIIPRLLGLLVVLVLAGFIWKTLWQPASVIEKSTDVEHVISNYEEFQNLYNTCQKLDADLKTIRATPDNDSMFAQFSKNAMIAAKRQQMTRWVNEYNAKSKMINRNLWKSSSLPYQLNEEHFPNYNGG